MQVETATIGEGNVGIGDTLRVMRRLVDKALLDPAVVETAQGIVRRLPPRAYDSEARAILDWVRARVRYTRDPMPYDPNVGPADQVKTPQRMLLEIRTKGVAVGDCDDYVTLLETLLRAVGLEAEAVVVSMDGGLFSHVLVRYLSPVQGKWVTLDAITPQEPGWFPEGTTSIAAFTGGRLKRETVDSVQGYARGRGPAAAPRGVGIVGQCLPTWNAQAGAARLPVKSGAAMAGYLVDEPATMPNDPLARVSQRLSPYTDLLWFGWATLSLLAAAGVLHAVRRRR